jgi:hypothetical protein
MESYGSAFVDTDRFFGSTGERWAQGRGGEQTHTEPLSCSH